ncbi:MAG TPA: hypothetical protein PK047_06955 [Saprospiraceae bacterium]|jgi:hypothetical protein|nr:hypothetical protein [Saprospiraceae bacterium]HRP41976.1 hypothetical protein [Saprospiraceae bacterium]
MKNLKIKMTDKQSTFLLQLLRNMAFEDVIENNNFRAKLLTAMLLYTPLQKLMGKLYMNKTTVTLDMSMSAALYAVFNSMDIAEYEPVLLIAQAVEDYVTKIVVQSRKNGVPC